MPTLYLVPATARGGVNASTVLQVMVLHPQRKIPMRGQWRSGDNVEGLDTRARRLVTVPTRALATANGGATVSRHRLLLSASSLGPSDMYLWLIDGKRTAHRAIRELFSWFQHSLDLSTMSFRSGRQTHHKLLSRYKQLWEMTVKKILEPYG